VNRMRANILQLLPVHEVSDVRRNEMHPAEPLVAETRAFEIDTAIENLKHINHQVFVKSQLN